MPMQTYTFTYTRTPPDSCYPTYFKRPTGLRRRTDARGAADTFRARELEINFHDAQALLNGTSDQHSADRNDYCLSCLNSRIRIATD
jgi:hypothetical protein